MNILTSFKSTFLRPGAASLILAAGSFLLPPYLRAAPTVATVIDEFVAAQDSLTQAAVFLHAKDQKSSLMYLDQTRALLQSIGLDVSDPSLRAVLGNKATRTARSLAALENKVELLNTLIVENDPAEASYNQRERIIRKIKIAASGVMSAVLKLGKPLLVEKNASAGFHTPGQRVVFKIDMSGCAETPVIRVVNASDAPAVDTSSVSLNPTTGVLQMRMGPAAGGARVQVTACGVTRTRLLYNYGTPPIPGVPEEFPSYLPKGSYQLSAGGSVSGRYYDQTGVAHTINANIPAKSYGPYWLYNRGYFARWLVSYFNSALQQAAQTISQPGCIQSYSYSAFVDNEFTATYSVTCASGGASATATMTFVLQKL